MSSKACVHCALPSSITSALNPTLSTSQLVTLETFSPALCFLAHTNNYFYFYMMFLLLTFCINVLHRLIVNGCVLSHMFDNKQRYNTIQNKVVFKINWANLTTLTHTAIAFILNVL